VIIGAIVIAIVFVIAGIWLVYLGATGETNFTFFGQTFSSANVGIAALFLGAVTVVLLMRRSLSSLDHAVRTEVAPQKRVQAWPEAKNARSLSRAVKALSATQWEILEAVAESDGISEYTLVRKVESVGPSELHFRLQGLVEDGFIARTNGKVFISDDVHRLLKGKKLKELRFSA